MKKRILPAFLAMLMLLSGCGNIDNSVQDQFDELSQYYHADNKDDTPSPPSSFTLPILQSQTLDPITCPDGAQQTLGCLLYEPLFELDTQFTPQPVLAESYSYDASSYTFSVVLRSGVTFSDGSTLDAEDAASCINRARTSARYASRLAPISSVSYDGNILYIRLKSTNSSFLSRLDIPIVKSDSSNDLVPLGTGPYAYCKASAGESYLEKRSDWWQKKSLPLSRIELLTVKDTDTMAYAFYAREIQLLSSDLTAADTVSVSGSGVYTDADTTSLLYIGINTTRQPLNDAAVRCSLQSGLDRVSYVNSFLMGHGQAAQYPLSPASSLYPKDTETPYSPDNYAKAAKQAKIDQGEERDLTLLVNEESSCKVSMARRIASDLSTYDLKISVETLPWDQYTSALSRGQFDLYLGECRMTADWDLSPLILPGGALNYGAYNVPAMTKLVNNYLAAADDAKRQTSAQELYKYFAQQCPIIPICFKQTSVLLTAATVDTITPTVRNPFFAMEKWTVHLSK